MTKIFSNIEYQQMSTFYECIWLGLAAWNFRLFVDTMNEVITLYVSSKLILAYHLNLPLHCLHVKSP